MRLVAFLLTLAAGVSTARGVKIGDLTHLQGSRTNRLVGMGLVVGLNGTGDGGKYLPAMLPLAQLHRRLASPVLTIEDLRSAKNVAIVQVEAVLPENGAREGDRVNVKVSSVGAAKSLAGGRLVLTPLVGPHPDDPRGVMALAGGPIEIEDPTVPTVGRIAQGATLEQDWIHSYIALGRDLSAWGTRSSVRPLDWIRPNEPYVTFVIDEPHAEWTMASAIAQSINEAESSPDAAVGDRSAQIAMAFDPRTVMVRIPEPERANPASFLARLEALELFMPFTEARVTVNRKKGAIVITGDVEISAAVVTYKGLTIATVSPASQPASDTPRVETRDFVVLEAPHRAGAKLTDLVEALNQLRVPAQDRITILEQLHKTGKLHAKLVVED